MFCIVLIIAFVVGMVALAQMRGWIPHLGLTLVYMGGICWASALWLPRILKRRQARDAMRDPAGTRRQMERQRFWRALGPVLAVGLASAGVLAGWVMSGRRSF